LFSKENEIAEDRVRHGRRDTRVCCLMQKRTVVEPNAFILLRLPPSPSPSPSPFIGDEIEIPG